VADEVPRKRDWSKLVMVWTPFVLGLLMWVAQSVMYMAGNGPAPPPPPVFPQQEGPVVGAADGAEFVPATGWVPDPEAVQAVVAAQQIPDFKDTPAGKAVRGDEDVFLWRGVRKVNNRAAPWYPNVNQRDVGCCVGCGFKHCTDVLQAVQIEQGGAFDFKPVAVEAIYGASRVEVGGGRIRGDGSVGAWAFDAVKRYGNLPMEGELADFSPQRARAWGRSGIPDHLEAKAREHIVKAGAKVTSAEEAAKAIRQGYPIPVCSNRGFTMSRDRDGFARPSGTWNHCMGIVGVRGGARPGFFILNSWGDQAHSGGVFPDDMPVAGFWADWNVVDGMLRQGDSFALSDVAGFPSRRLDWLVHVRPLNGGRHATARRLDAPGAALFGLAW
jgi:hypothetical protein